MVCLLENRLIVNFRLKCLQSFIDQLATQGFFLFDRQVRVAERMRDRYRRHNAVRTDRQRDRGDCAHVDDRDAGSFNFFHHRCTATRTRPSGRGEDNRADFLCEQSLGDFLSEALGGGNGGTVTYGGVELVM